MSSQKNFESQEVEATADAFDLALLTQVVLETLNDLLPPVVANEHKVAAHNPQQYRLLDTNLSQLVIQRHTEHGLDTQVQDPRVREQYDTAKERQVWREVAPERFKSFLDRSTPSSALRRQLVEYKTLSSEALASTKREADNRPGHTQNKKVKTGEVGEKLSRKEKNKKRSQANIAKVYSAKNSQVFQAITLNLSELRVSTTGWKGIDATSAHRKRISSMLKKKDRALFQVLAQFQQIPFDMTSGIKQRPTLILEEQGRSVIFRSNRTDWVMGLLPALSKTIQKFVEATRRPDVANSRGDHFFCIVGADRQSKKIPAKSKWERDYQDAVDELFQCSAMVAISKLASAIVWHRFPMIAARMQGAVTINRAKYGLPENRYGIFWNFCVNAPTGNIRNVFCGPHTDSKNGAILVCVVFVYYYGDRKGNADEKIWLVFWEAGLIVQIPVGVFIVYPSALFLHFNVNIEDVIVVTNGGELPTPANSVPLGQDSDLEGGRASMVWFTQATMLQSAELPTDTVREMRDLEAKAEKAGKHPMNTSSTYNVEAALADGMFPFNL